jgi:hypothetical protein
MDNDELQPTTTPTEARSAADSAPEAAKAKTVADARDYFRQEILKGYSDWYFDEATLNEKKYLRVFWIGLAAGLCATVLAAVPKGLFQSFGNGKEIAADLVSWAVVLLSALATICNSTLVPRFKRFLDDRERGRNKLALLNNRLMVANLPKEAQSELLEACQYISAVELDSGSLTSAQEGAGKQTP